MDNYYGLKSCISSENLEILANSLFMKQKFLDGRHIAGFQNPQTMMMRFQPFPSVGLFQVMSDNPTNISKKLEKNDLNN
jgi:hypothetical protein